MTNKLLIALLFFSISVNAQYTHVDTLMGSNTPERAWWDLKYYNLKVKVDIEKKFFNGQNTIVFVGTGEQKEMQIDLQPPMTINSIYYHGKFLKYRKEGPNAHFIELPPEFQNGLLDSVNIYFSGSPKIAPNAPWDGGITWSTDAAGRPFAATSNQGIGASIWWPCKDHPADEPDSAQITVTVPDSLWDISNGQLRAMSMDKDGNRTCTWFVANPINNYGININIGNYVSWDSTYNGIMGKLPLAFYVLPENLAKAKTQFNDVYRMLAAFEHWFGPYPFYEDGYKLVQVPYLGMEHQSSVTYGNGFANGYRGRDLSGTGWGLKWDFIIIHESGHEWFANNITDADKSDMWIHESFTNYSESLFTEYYYGKEAGAEYVRGLRNTINNDKPIIGDYGVGETGSGDMYNKGGNMLHTLRQWVNNDELWRSMLVGLNTQFYHQTVGSQDIFDYLSEKSDLDLDVFFNQYLRTTNIPILAYKTKGKKKVFYKWENTLVDFNMPVDINLDTEPERIYPRTDKWKKVKTTSFSVSPDYYINTRLEK